ncbi:EthD family reductase [Larkinella humicola]|uniref:EthD family reductase n=1 Tax=Larkinella humicola TaxID=2607654 RepID=A0A5N1JCP3_9BACT|nr:EthD family reductase [Larkinella humicola]KAA9352720.1 EthD family reductase [Larkinella humicola]
MITATLLYPQTADTRFDLDYYLNQHTPLVREHLTPDGLVGIDLEQGLAGMAPDTPPTYTVIARLHFATLADLQTALIAHAPALLADLPNFTDAQPIMQINQSL